MQDSTDSTMEIEQPSSEGYIMHLRSRAKIPEKPREPVLSRPSKKIKKTRAKYQKIEDTVRIALFEAVKKRGEKLKTAANRLKINYSSAKSILFTYRKKGRICKKPNGPCKSTADSEGDIADIKKEESAIGCQFVQDLTAGGSTPQKVDSPNQDTVLRCDSNSEQADHLIQSKNVPAYLKCFSKSTSILERIKTMSENFLLESHNEKKMVPSRMNGSIKGLVASLEDLICDLQKLDAPPTNPMTPNVMSSPRFIAIPPHLIPHNPSSLFGFQPVFFLRPGPINNPKQSF